MPGDVIGRDVILTANERSWRALGPFGYRRVYRQDRPFAPFTLSAGLTADIQQPRLKLETRTVPRRTVPPDAKTPVLASPTSGLPQSSRDFTVEIMRRCVDDALGEPQRKSRST